jgi:hypothetical protein
VRERERERNGFDGSLPRKRNKRTNPIFQAKKMKKMKISMFVVEPRLSAADVHRKLESSAR